MTDWYLLPLRGGSRGIAGKNRRNLRGKPLMRYALETLLKVAPAHRIIIASDDDELRAIARDTHVDLLLFHLPKQSGKETLDDVALEVCAYLQTQHGAQARDTLTTTQATCPLLTPGSLIKARKLLQGGAGSVVTASDARHLYWQLNADGQPEPAYAKRLNRQQLPPFYRESGAIIAARIGDIMAQRTRIVAPTELLRLDAHEGLDIDDFSDWSMAEHLLGKKRIVIKADSSAQTGMGHLYRSVALADLLAKHQPLIVSNIGGDHAQSEAFFDQSVFDFHPVTSDAAFVTLMQEQKADVIILDQLATQKAYVQALKETGASIISFEDRGEGALLADVLVCDLYERTDIPASKQLCGIENAILNPCFEWAQPKARQIPEIAERILVLYGGTDPANLAQRTLQCLSQIRYSGEVTLVQGRFKQHKIDSLERYHLRGTIINNAAYMPGILAEADLAFSSAGRTLSELMVMGIPSICVCQNERELTHTHAKAEHGVLAVGLASTLSDTALMEASRTLISDAGAREQMRRRALQTAQRRGSNQEILARISERIGINLL